MQHSLEGLQLVEEITERGYAEFDHNIPSDMIDSLIERYADFTLSHPDPEPETMSAMLPDTEDVDKLSHQLDDLDRSKDTQEKWHKYRTNAAQIGKPDGYTNRTFQEKALKLARGVAIPPEDPKEFYHFTPAHYANMAANHRQYDWGSIPQEVALLNTAFAGIHERASTLILNICGLIEEQHPEIRSLVSPQAIHSSPVRLLFYHPSTQESLGAGHYDKGAMTLQLAESHEGLRVAPDGQDDLLVPVIRSADKAAFFPSLAIQNNFADTPYKPGWHDIVKTDRLNDGRSVPPKAIEVCARWAIIFFANYENFVQPDKHLTHTR